MGAKLLLQPPLLGGEIPGAVQGAAVKGAESAKLGNLLRMPPLVEGEEHVRPQQQENLPLGVQRPDLPEGVKGVALPLPAELQVRRLRHTAQVQSLDGETGHLQPVLRPGNVLSQGLMGWDPGGDHQQLIQVQRLGRLAGRRHVSRVDRVEGPPIYADLHRSSPFPCLNQCSV